MTFFGTEEYRGFNRTDAQFVGDLYRTFFDREPDSGGLAHWTGQLAQGLSREAVLAWFMFSPEFVAFNARYFGNNPNRPEVDGVIGIYGGFLARIPDANGLRHWVGRLRQAQCAGGSAVNAEIETLSSLFATSPEYAARGRTTANYVDDLYNTFLRRGADLEGSAYWVQRIDSGASSREDARRAFIASPEFQARVQAIIAAGCQS
jgi:serralysin